MKHSIFYFGIFLLIAQARSQYLPPEAHPTIGWDSLKSLVVYPETAKRAGVQGNVDVSVELDSLDNVANVSVMGFEVFHPSIIDAVKKVTWTHGLIYGEKRPTTAFFTIEFKLKPYAVPKRIILHIEAEIPIIHKDY